MEAACARAAVTRAVKRPGKKIKENYVAFIQPKNDKFTINGVPPTALVLEKVVKSECCASIDRPQEAKPTATLNKTTKDLTGDITPPTPRYQLRLRRRYTKEKEKTYRANETINLIIVKGKFGCTLDYNSRKTIINARLARKYLLKLLKHKRNMRTLWSGRIGVIGRNLYGSILYRSGFYAKTAGIKKRARKYDRNHDKSQTVILKKEEKSNIKNEKKGRRKKKKVYTWLVRRNSKWFRSRFVTKKYLSNFGERGHIFYQVPRKFATRFERLNTIYKKAGFASTRFQEKKSKELVQSLIRLKRFGPYKVKGLKFLGQRGLLREGKSRKF